MLYQFGVEGLGLFLCFEMGFYIALPKNPSSKLCTDWSPRSSYGEALEAPIGEEKHCAELSGQKAE